jgi:hypothetical protein
VTLVNIRDFPIPNVPLFYAAFLFFLIVTGPDKLFEGYKRTKFLCIILSIFWCYQKLILLVKGGSISLYELSNLLEPIMIFGAAGMATIRPGGTKAALWALVLAITFSAACGIWIYFIGDPIESLMRTLHSQVGGNFLQGKSAGSINITGDLLSEIKRNSGLSSRIFGFSYQLAIATLPVIIILLTMKRSFNMKYVTLLGVFVILLVGIITGAERGPLLSVSAGLLVFFFFEREKMLNVRTILAFIISVSIIAVLFTYSSTWEDRYTIHKRTTGNEKTYIRAFVMPKAATLSVFSEPLGAGAMTRDHVTPHWGKSDHYIKVAYENDFINPDGPKDSHNHFANVVMYTGVIGIFLIILLFWGLWKKIQKIKYNRSSNLREEFVLPFICITAILHSFFQNAGFYFGEPATQIAFGLLWGTTARIKYPRFNHLLNKWVIE